MKHNRHMLTAILTFFFISQGLLAQSNIVATGGDANSTQGSVSYSIGQIDYLSISGTGGTVNQGVQQPFEIFVLGNDDYKEITLEAIVYPNPTPSNIILKLENLEFGDLYFVLYDLTGRNLQEGKVLTERTNIVMEGYNSAAYFLSIINDKGTLKTFKIIKH